MNQSELADRILNRLIKQQFLPEALTGTAKQVIRAVIDEEIASTPLVARGFRCQDVICEKRTRLGQDIARFISDGQVDGLIRRAEFLVNHEATLSAVKRALRGHQHKLAADIVTEYRIRHCKRAADNDGAQVFTQ